MDFLQTYFVKDTSVLGTYSKTFFSLFQAKGRQMKLCKDRSDSSDYGSETQEERRDSTDKHVTFSMKPGQNAIYFRN